MRHRISPSLLLVALLLGACSPLRPSDPVRFYDLDTRLSATANADGMALLIGPFELADYLNRPQLVVRRDSQLELREFDRWAEPLDQAVLRRLAAGIGAELDTSRVYQFPEISVPAYRLRVTGRILRLEADSNGRVMLQARWRLLDMAGATVAGPYIADRQGSVDDSDDAGAITRALGALLDELSGDIAQSIRTVTASVAQ